MLGSCVCSLSNQQRILAGKPLHRLAVRVDGGARVVSAANNFNLRITKEPRRIRPDPSGSLVLVSIRVSSRVDRLFQMGLLTSNIIHSKMEVLLQNDRLTASIRNSTESELKEYLDFIPTIELFDMERVCKMKPLLELCGICLLVVFCCEQFCGALSRIVRTRISVSPSNVELRGCEGHTPDETSRRSSTTAQTPERRQESLPIDEDKAGIAEQIPTMLIR